MATLSSKTYNFISPTYVTAIHCTLRNSLKNQRSLTKLLQKFPL